MTLINSATILTPPVEIVRSAGPFHIGQLLAGTSIEVTGVLGIGGMGVVYEAFDQLLRLMVMERLFGEVRLSICVSMS